MAKQLHPLQRAWRLLNVGMTRARRTGWSSRTHGSEVSGPAAGTGSWTRGGLCRRELIPATDSSSQFAGMRDAAVQSSTTPVVDGATKNVAVAPVENGFAPSITASVLVPATVVRNELVVWGTST